MPYASNKQAAFIHIHHPEIAAKWHEEGHGYVKGGKNDPNKKRRRRRVKKSRGEGWLKPLAVGTAGGALANQLPSFEEQRRLRENRRRRKEASRIRKIAYEDHVRSDDPEFNHQAAQKAFDLVMKMDDDTAEVFTEMVVGDLFETDLEKNLRTLQRHLDEVIAKRVQRLKTAVMRSVSKGDSDGAIEYATALRALSDALEPVSKKTPYDYGYQWKEQDFLRDPSSGRFRTKVSHNQKNLLRGKTGRAILGVETPKEHNGVRLSEEDRIAFQDEYRQLAGFLSTMQQSTGGKGNQEVMLHYRDGNGNQFSQVHRGLPPINDLANPNFRLTGIEAKPTTLNAGGAAFGLATAMGGTLSPSQVHGINQADKGTTSFANDWLSAGDPSGKISNQRLYDRMAHSGAFLSRIGPPGSKTQLAGRFAEIIGSHGPEAEAVLGPTARKTAYRYRGTEKTPSKQLVNAYASGIAQGKRTGIPPVEEDELRGVRGRGLSHGSMVAAGARTARVTERRERPGEAPPPSKMGAARQALEARAPTWEERDLGRQVVVQYLRNRMPKKGLYNLQLHSGNTPPSEGVILNAKGQIVTQAVGYGDDHYLPFNLKNLKGLKGGEYIRTRSVGGLTSEDVYTGLMMGARQVTVTSRSGTYTMTFQPDFRGGRRHNDKAKRMTRRYEQLLDAVQSQQVERIDIDPDMRQQIEREVREEMSGPGWSQRDRMDAVKERIDEFKESPYITDRDEERAEAQIKHMTQGVSDEKEINRVRGQVYDDLLEQKETRFRLNSQGYKAALDALQEQFPYYLQKPRWTPPRDAEQQIVPELDRGYVEPGRNRPTAAKAGLYGTVKGVSGKFSAAQANFQGASAVRRGGSKEVSDETTAGKLEPKKAGEEKDLTDKEKRAAAAENIKRDRDMVTTAKQIQALGDVRLDDDAKDLYKHELAYDEDDLKDPDKFAKFHKFAMWLTDKAKEPTLKRKWESSTGHREAKPYDRNRATVWPKVPATFEEKAYQPGADEKRVTRALDEIDRKTKESPLHGKPYSALSEDEHRQLHDAFAEMHAMLTEAPGTLDKTELTKLGLNANSPGLGGLTSDKEKILDRMELQQRSRSLTTRMSDEDRQKRNPRKVVHNETKTDEEYSEPAKKALKEAEYLHELRRQVENAPGDHDEEADLLRGLGDAWENAVNRGEINTDDDLKGFRQTHNEELDKVLEISHKIRSNTL